MGKSCVAETKYKNMLEFSPNLKNLHDAIKTVISNLQTVTFLKNSEHSGDVDYMEVFKSSYEIVIRNQVRKVDSGDSESTEFMKEKLVYLCEAISDYLQEVPARYATFLEGKFAE